MFACNENEANVIILDETRRNGYIAVFGSLVVSNDNIIHPEVRVLSDLRQAQKDSRQVRIKYQGPKIKKS
jgi:hypothetical protein